MLLEDLMTNGGEILRLGHGNAASQVEQGVRQRLQDNLITSPYERDPISFLQIQRAANLPWNSHLAPTAYSTNDHHAYLHLAESFILASQLTL